MRKGGESMPDYRKLYTLMFNAATDALAAMGQHNYGTAAKILMQAQQQAEEHYIRQGEPGKRTNAL